MKKVSGCKTGVGSSDSADSRGGAGGFGLRLGFGLGAGAAGAAGSVVSGPVSAVGGGVSCGPRGAAPSGGGT